MNPHDQGIHQRFARICEKMGIVIWTVCCKKKEKSAEAGLNRRPHNLQSYALPLSYRGILTERYKMTQNDVASTSFTI